MLILLRWKSDDEILINTDHIIRIEPTDDNCTEIYFVGHTDTTPNKLTAQDSLKQILKQLPVINAIT